MVRPIQWKMCLGPKEKCPPYEFYRFQRHTPKSRWLMAQRVFHGLDPITPELKEVIYACTNCLMCQELCGVRDDGYGPWDITVAMREEITEKEGPIEPHRPIYEGLQQHDNPWAQPKVDAGRLGRRAWAQKTRASRNARTLLFAGCSADRASGRERRRRAREADAKGRRRFRHSRRRGKMLRPLCLRSRFPPRVRALERR